MMVDLTGLVAFNRELPGIESSAYVINPRGWGKFGA